MSYTKCRLRMSSSGLRECPVQIFVWGYTESRTSYLFRNFLWKQWLLTLSIRYFFSLYSFIFAMLFNLVLLGWLILTFCTIRRRPEIQYWWRFRRTVSDQGRFAPTRIPAPRKIFESILIGLFTFPVSLFSIFVVFQRFVYFWPFYVLPILMDPECSRTTGYQRFTSTHPYTVREARSRPCRSQLGPTAREPSPITYR